LTEIQAFDAIVFAASLHHMDTGGVLAKAWPLLVPGEDLREIKNLAHAVTSRVTVRRGLCFRYPMTLRKEG
jgi:hypothetical protein